MTRLMPRWLALVQPRRAPHSPLPGAPEGWGTAESPRQPCAAAEAALALAGPAAKSSEQRQSSHNQNHLKGPGEACTARPVAAFDTAYATALGGAAGATEHQRRWAALRSSSSHTKAEAPATLSF